VKKSDAAITTIVGMRGCGKSTLTQCLASDKKYQRKIVFDMVMEWEGLYMYAETLEEFSNLWRENFHKRAFTIIIRFEFGSDIKNIIKLQTDIVRLVYLTGRDSELYTCLIFEEAHYYFPNSGLHPINMGLLTTGRHAFIDVIANSQRPASISKLLISQSEKIYIGSLF
jgi:energy-coupling factor transporter ATP-binding protein EcfA2